jgi:hypothetical protein
MQFITQHPRCHWFPLVLLAWALLPARGAKAAEPIEVQVVVWSTGAGPDAVTFVYAASAKARKTRQALEAQARQDFQRLAAGFGQAAVGVKVRTVSEPAQAPPTTSAEGKLLGLVNRPAGWLNIGPFLQVFSRYERLSLTYQVMPPFQFQGPKGPFDDPSLAMMLDQGGTAYTYHVRLKHAPGQDSGKLPPFDAPRSGLARLGKLAYVVVTLMALAAGVAVYSLLQFWVGRKTN